jgi:hypothetical protein
MEPQGVFGRDRVAAGLAACAILLLFVFFYALHQNVTGLAREIDELKALNSAVLELDARHATLDGKVTELGALPRHTSLMAMENQVKAMAHAAEDLDLRLDGKHREKLAAIRLMLQELGEDLHSAK